MGKLEETARIYTNESVRLKKEEVLIFSHWLAKIEETMRFVFSDGRMPRFGTSFPFCGKLYLEKEV